uniref:Uncharacterized protein n=1 Tax=Myotis myotis TaxID=51298 RepID=A0A7J8AM34_MYOMY|nr:hypothetical protein mMyoMyo1_008112 [Myotis myotis]
MLVGGPLCCSRTLSIWSSPQLRLSTEATVLSQASGSASHLHTSPLRLDHTWVPAPEALWGLWGPQAAAEPVWGLLCLQQPKGVESSCLQTGRGPEVIQAYTGRGHPEALPFLVWAKSCFPDVALPGKAFPRGPQSEASFLPHCDPTPGEADTGLPPRG